MASWYNPLYWVANMYSCLAWLKQLAEKLESILVNTIDTAERAADVSPAKSEPG